MKPFFNFRNLSLVALTIVLLAVKFLTDPTAGAVTYEFLIYVTTPILVVLLGHYLRKLLFPYVDMGDLYDKAKTSAIGSAITFLGMCLFVMAIYGLFGPSARAQDVNTYIPTQAKIHLPVLIAEQERLWPDLPKKLISPA
jgi:predicted permease